MREREEAGMRIVWVIYCVIDLTVQIIFNSFFFLMKESHENEKRHFFSLSLIKNLNRHSETNALKINHFQSVFIFHRKFL